MTSTIVYHVGDVRDAMTHLDDGMVGLVVTSPPFLALRSYLPDGHPDKHREIGSEATPAAFLDTMLGLTADWRRVVAGWGSIAVEIGDTYSGSGGAGGDYGDDGLRAGQSKFDGAARRSRGRDSAKSVSNPARHTTPAGWPLAKSLCGIPTLYTWSLAYGRNILTGAPSPAGEWRIRNLLTWTRPNPPVGALGDKFRPATSYVTVACTGAKRWFDLDAVRLPGSDNTHARTAAGVDRRATTGKAADDTRRGGNYSTLDTLHNDTNGAPPLDWWDANDLAEHWQPLHRLPTSPYKGSHYATFPEALPRRLIEAMCPREVCAVCGEPRRRITRTTQVALDQRTEAHVTTLGWSDCGHGSVVCTHCGVLVPLDHAVHRPGEAPSREAPVGDDSLLDESSAGESKPTQHAGDVRDVRGGVPGAPGGAVLHEELLGAPSAPGGTSEQHQRAGTEQPDVEGRPAPAPGRLRDGLGAGGDPRADQERPHDGASQGDAGAPGPAVGALGDRPSSQRSEGRQQDHQPRSRDASSARRDGDLPPLPGDVPGPVGGYVCPCGSDSFKYITDQYRPGIVLDPFGGSGTTGVAAARAGRDVILVDLDARNRDLARARIADQLRIVDEHTIRDTTVWTVEAPLPNQRQQVAGQTSIFDELEAS